MEESAYSTIVNSTLTSNSFGIRMEYNLYANIEGNILMNNAYGMYFDYEVNHGTIRYNYFELNYMYAVSIKGSNEYNEFYHNAFINNAGGGSQAYDDSTNYWHSYYQNSGNYWSDWPGFGNYTIDGIGGNADQYPLSSNPIGWQLNTKAS